MHPLRESMSQVVQWRTPARGSEPRVDSALTFSIQPGRVAIGLALIISLLLLAHDVVLGLNTFTGHGRLLGLGALFDLDKEQNLPTLFSSLLILFNAALCTLAWKFQRQLGAPEPRWLVLCVALMWVGIDEFCSFHETLATPLRTAFHLNGFLYFAWVIPYGIAAIVLGASLVPFLFTLPAGTRWTMVAAGAVYVFGAVGLEMIGARTFEFMGNERSPLWMLSSTFEEVFEMSGMTIFAYAMLRLLVERYGFSSIQLSLNAGGRRVSSDRGTSDLRG